MSNEDRKKLAPCIICCKLSSVDIDDETDDFFPEDEHVCSPCCIMLVYEKWICPSCYSPITDPEKSVLFCLDGCLCNKSSPEIDAEKQYNKRKVINEFSYLRKSNETKE